MAYGATLTLPTISGSHTDMPILLKAVDFPASAIDGSANAIANGGGDLVAYTNSGKGTQLPIEVVTFVSSGSPEAEVWVKIPTAATANTIFIEKDTVQTSQPAVTSTYGRNAVWSDYDAVYHGNDLVDSTGNGNTLTANAGATAGDTGGKIGDAFALDDASSQYFSATTSIASNPLTLQGWFKPDADTGAGQGIIALGDDTSTDRARLVFQDNVAGNPARSASLSGANQTFADSTVEPAISAWSMGHATLTTGSESNIFTNGADKQTGSTVANSTAYDSLYLGAWDNNATVGLIQFFSGLLDELRARASILADNWIATEYDNQNASVAWVSNDGWTDSGAPTTTPKTLSYTAIGTASLAIAVIYAVAPTITAIGTASLVKKISKSFSAAALGTANLVKKMFKTSASTATGTASLDEATIQSHTASATATGTSSLSTIFTAGTGFIRNFIRKIALSLGLGL